MIMASSPYPIKEYGQNADFTVKIEYGQNADFTVKIEYGQNADFTVKIGFKSGDRHVRGRKKKT